MKHVFLPTLARITSTPIMQEGMGTLFSSCLSIHQYFLKLLHLQFGDLHITMTF